MERIKLLLVDAEEGFAHRVVRDLGGPRFDVTWAATAEEGERSARTWKPDLVLIDVNLPDSNGFKLFTRLNRLSELTATRFVITGADVPEKTFVDHGKLKRHADLYIHKPFSSEELKARFTQAFGIESDAASDDTPPLPLAKTSEKSWTSGTSTRKAGAEDYLDELDDLLADVDMTALHSAARDDDSDLNELNRLLGGEAAVPEPPPLPQPPALPEPEPVEDLVELSEEEEDASVSLVLDTDETPDQDLEALPLEATADELDDLFPVGEEAGLDDLLDTEEAPPAPLPVDGPSESTDLEALESLDAALDQAEDLLLPEEESDPIAHVRESELAALIDKLEAARAERDQALRELAAMQNTAPPSQTKPESPDLERLHTDLKKTQDVARLKAQEAAELAAQREALTQDLSEAHEEIARLRSKLKTHGEEITAQYRNTLTQAKAKLDEIRAALEAEQGLRLAADETLRQSREAQSALLEERDALRADLDALRATLEEQNAQAAERLERERRQAAERLEHETALLLVRIEELGGGHQEANSQLDILRARVAELERLMTEQADQYEARLNENSEQEKALRRKIEATHEQQLAELTLQLNSARERSDDLDKQGEALHGEMAALRDRLAERSAEVKTLTTRLDDLTAAMNDRERHLEDTAGEAEQRVHMLNAEIKRLKEANARNEKRVIDAFTRLKADMEARARVEKALMLALKLVKSPGSSGATPRVEPGQRG